MNTYQAIHTYLRCFPYLKHDNLSQWMHAPLLFFLFFWFKLPKIGTHPQLKFKREKDMYTYLRLFPYPKGFPIQA
ncbi:hypothetical protein AMTRI_Chr07g78570 [Amborella trichopoda]